MQLHFSSSGALESPSNVSCALCKFKPVHECLNINTDSVLDSESHVGHITPKLYIMHELGKK